MIHEVIWFVQKHELMAGVWMIPLCFNAQFQNELRELSRCRSNVAIIATFLLNFT